MRYDVNGDLLTSDCDVIIHQVNCKGVMGSGIAAQIRRIYPNVYADYMKIYRAGRLQLGNIIATQVGDKVIYSICAQYDYGYNGKFTDEEAFSVCLAKVYLDLKQRNLLQAKVGIPYKIGAGLGGGDWQIISTLLEVFASYINLYVYKLKGGN